MDTQEDDERVALEELLKSIKSMAESQAKLVEIAQSILKETKRRNKTT